MTEKQPVDPATVALLRAAGCVWAEDEARILTLTARTAEELRGLLERRAAGEPLEQVVGWAEFCGLRLYLAPGVFVPRRRSEFLAECAIGVLAEAAATPGRVDPLRVLDLCCGSGALGLAVATVVPGVELFAVDDSAEAVGCARKNLGELDGTVYQGDLFVALPRSARAGFDLIVASPPYVPSADIELLPAEARLYEPRSALNGGADGTVVQRRIFADASGWLAPYGRLVIEANAAAAEHSADIGRELGFSVDVRRDPERDATALVARLG